MEQIIANCGLVCTDCGMYKKEKCKGCFSGKPMFTNCPIKKCVTEKNIQTCAECKEFSDLKKCKKLNNLISKVVGFIFRTDRIGNLNKMREGTFMKNKGFALIEMLVVLVILGIVAYFILNKGSMKSVKTKGTIDHVEKAQEMADKAEERMKKRMQELQKLPE